MWNVQVSWPNQINHYYISSNYYSIVEAWNFIGNVINNSSYEQSTWYFIIEKVEVLDHVAS